MAKMKILDVRNPTTIINRLESDLRTISNGLKTENHSGYEHPTPTELIEAIKNIDLMSRTLKNKDITRVQQLLRYLCFMLEHHESSILSSTASRAAKIQLREKLKELTNNIGTVPQLTTQVELPEKRFLPQKMNDTIKRWKKISCPNPKRTASSIEQGKITFLTRGGENAVRSALRAEIKAKKLATLDRESMQQYLNLLDTEYYKEELFDADHMQPSSGLISRLKEMIELMNLDPTFKEDMIDSEYNDDYFLEDEKGNIIGNYWLYASHYNAMQNLWFLLTSDNSGGGKVDADPISWLENNSVGKEYLKYLHDNGRFIDKSGIFYMVRPDAIALKESFTKWVEGNNLRLIKFCRLFSQIHHELRDGIHDGMRTQKRLRSDSEMGVMLSTNADIVLNKDPEESSVSDVDPELAEEADKLARKKLKSNSRHTALLMEAAQIQRDTIREARKEISAQHQTRASNPVQLTLSKK